jgi:RsiW-degrading membrane proteinase PrsW (M82 family)
MTVVESPVTWRPRPLQIVSWVGLGVSTVALLAALPNLFTNGGGAGTVLSNAAASVWTLLLLVVAVASVRTIGLQAVAGAWFSGFFAITALAGLIGRPVVNALGADSTIAVAVWAPVTEEALKLMPVALFLVLASRNHQSRPSVGDAVLFGATVGAGFAVYENALFARGVGGVFDHLPFSPLLPTLQTASDGGSMLVGGHLVYTALAALGLGIALLYRRRTRLAWFALPVAFGVAVIEHATANGLSLVSPLAARPGWIDATLVLTLNGYLSTLLLFIGVAGIAIAERRLLLKQFVPATRQHFPPDKWSPLRSLYPSGAQIGARGAALAMVQHADVVEIRG